MENPNTRTSGYNEIALPSARNNRGGDVKGYISLNTFLRKKLIKADAANKIRELLAGE